MIGTATWPPTFADKKVGADIPRAGYVPSVTFQVRPQPGECDPGLPQTAHASGMLVGLLDGSIRRVSADVSPAEYWAAVTPDGGETLHPDW
jgi:hypothetical protein